VLRQRILVALGAAVSVMGMVAAGAGGALAKTCPWRSTSTVTGTPSYKYTRGCIVSFDGTPIVYNLFEPLDASAAHPVYTVLQGPAWATPGDTTPDMQAPLIANDYAELTWDPRGFGQSGGVSELDAPWAEGRDVSALIDKVLTGRPEIVTDRAGSGGQPRYINDSRQSNTYAQPVVGMISGSYGGGIQFATAAFDDRVKAIVPEFTWNDLNYALWPGNVVKQGWMSALYAAGLAASAGDEVGGDAAGAPSGGDGGMQTGGYDPMIHYAALTGLALGYPNRQMLQWFGQRSMSVYGAGPSGHLPDVPTLLIQGTVDDLFNLNQAWANYREIKGRYPNLPVKMIALCDGHVTCPIGPAPSGLNYSTTASSSSPVWAGKSTAMIEKTAPIAWLNHYLRGQGATDGIPSTVIYQDQKGSFYPLGTFPTTSAPGPAKIVSAPLSGTLVDHDVPTGTGTTGDGGVDFAVSDGPTSSSDPGQVTVPILTAPAKSDVPVVGIGHVTADVTVAGAATELFFRLIDKDTGDVVDVQTTPLRVDNLDLQDDGGNPNVPPGPQKVSLDLAGTAYDLPPGDTLELQVSTSTDSYSTNRGSAIVTLANGTVSVPTLAPES
jgi:ABC-2 type transport system ATP-binding protein